MPELQQRDSLELNELELLLQGLARETPSEGSNSQSKREKEERKKYKELV